MSKQQPVETRVYRITADTVTNFIMLLDNKKMYETKTLLFFKMDMHCIQLFSPRDVMKMWLWSTNNIWVLGNAHTTTSTWRGKFDWNFSLCFIYEILTAFLYFCVYNLHYRPAKCSKSKLYCYQLVYLI